jgi:hypothetical protein
MLSWWGGRLTVNKDADAFFQRKPVGLEASMHAPKPPTSTFSDAKQVTVPPLPPHLQNGHGPVPVVKLPPHLAATKSPGLEASRHAPHLAATKFSGLEASRHAPHLAATKFPGLEASRHAPHNMPLQENVAQPVRKVPKAPTSGGDDWVLPPPPVDAPEDLTPPRERLLKGLSHGMRTPSSIGGSKPGHLKKVALMDVTTSRNTSRRGSVDLNAPDESTETEEDYHRQMEATEDAIHSQMEATEDAIHRDAVKLDFYSKELEQTLQEERGALAKIERLRETKGARETRVKDQRAQLAEKKAKLEDLRQSWTRLREAKVTSVFPNTHIMVLTITDRHRKPVKRKTKLNRSFMLKRPRKSPNDRRQS